MKYGIFKAKTNEFAFVREQFPRACVFLGGLFPGAVIRLGGGRVGGGNMRLEDYMKTQRNILSFEYLASTRPC